MESLGRRILLLAGFGLCCGSCAVLTLALNLQVCSCITLVLLVYFGVGVGGLSVPACLSKVNPGRVMMLLCECFSLPIVFVPVASCSWKQRWYTEHELNSLACQLGHSWQQGMTSEHPQILFQLMP